MSVNAARSGAVSPMARTPSSPGFLGLILFSVLLLSPAFAAVIETDDPLQDRLQACAFSLVIWMLWLALWARAYWACLAASPLILVVPMILYLLVTYHAQPTAAVIGIIADTNLHESTEFLRGLWLPIFVGYAILACLVVVSLRLMRRYRLIWTHRSRYWVLVLVPLIWGGLYWLYQQQELSTKDFRPYPDPFRVPQQPLAVEYLRNALPFGVLLQFGDYLSGERNISKAERALAGFHFGSKQTSASNVRQVFVLVIGESARRDRWSLYGYGRPTSPLMQQQPNLVAYEDVVTMATATRVSVPVMLTRRTAQQAKDSSFHERSLISAFREAGFSTYWLSTQAPLGMFDAPIAVNAREADHVAYFNGSGAWELTPPDGVLLEPLKRALAQATEPRQLIVLHTLGSHYDYRYRYPHAFERFKPAPSPADAVDMHDDLFREKLNNAYDNSILYTDYFISQVIAAVSQSDRPVATVLYLSDHGEDVFDKDCGEVFRGRSSPISYRIPLFLWYSDEYQRAYPRKIEMLKQHRLQPLTTRAVFPTMLDAADVHFPGEDLSGSVMSAKFEIQPRVVTTFNGVVDFDRAHFTRTCRLEN
jgi:glucan phosphoethanolaminetransferase (alkaline phosphatase superfamily)